ncbi:uncharacterized protein LOC132554899 [Ylistrum balloti]|uniref:uncharacterized protein LOC132554899 n=1 Tax=Ylistrum balloti TaxID=509963 RepID=UPI002905F40F|nr:uncharacterized protein LOC132554899 [Ylistrum balloti]
MGKIGDITIQTDGGKEVYRSGEEVKGVWRVHVIERVTVNDVAVSLNGETYVKWTESSVEARAPDLKFISREKYTNQKKAVVFQKTTLEAGVHEYPFSFRMPTDKMPSSFEGKRGCTRYWLYLKITRPLPWRDVVSDKCVTFIDDVDINLQYYAKPLTKKKSTHLSKILGFGDAGEVTLTANVHRTGFCAGEAIPVTVDAVNASSKDLGKLKVSLVQRVSYKANGDTETEDTVIYTKTGSDPIKQRHTRSWKDELVHIDAVPPSTRTRASFCLNVSYFIKVYIDISFLSGGDLVLWLPITIGTVPQGYKKATPAGRATTSNIPVIDLSNALTHTRCNRGWEKFNRSTDNAIPEYVSYTPMCVFVPNYTYKPPPKKATNKMSAAVQVRSPPISGTTKTANAAAISNNPTQVQPSASTSGPIKSTTSATKPTNSPIPVQTSVTISGSTKSTACVAKPTNSRTVSQTSILTPGQERNTTSATQDSSTSNGGQSRPEPSAPPAPYDEAEGYNIHDDEVLLPSYEELFGQGAAEGNIEVEETATGKVFMLIRFQSSRRQEFVNSMKNYSSGLEKFQGYLSALQHKASNIKVGTWNKASLLAILTFECADMARDWLKTTPEICMEKWLGGCDILLVESSEPFQQDHQVLSMSNIGITVEDTNENLARYRYLLNEYLKPSRVRIGGVSVASSKVNHCLRGKWEMDIEKTIVILSWPTMDVLRKYRGSVDPEIYQESLELRNKVFEIVLTAVVQLGPLPSLANSEEEDGGEVQAS